MRFLALRAVTLSFALGAPVVAHAAPSSAQENDDPMPPLPASASDSPARAPSGGTCRLGTHDGIEDADARTAALLLCSEIARLGPPADTRYHVTLGKLGTLIIYSVTREGDTPDVTADVRELRLHGIEEASVAAPRLAEAIVHGTAIAETEKVDNIVGEETRRPARKGGGSAHFSLGIVGNLPPLDQGVGPAPGLDLHVHYETKSWELGGGIRFGGGQVTNTAPSVAFFMAELGGRYYATDTDVSPYFGGGLAWDYLSLSLPGTFSGNNGGLGAFMDAGVELLRAYHTHLSFGVRADLPFFSLSNNDDLAGTCVEAQGTVSNPSNCAARSTFYYWPLSIEVRLTF
jgi:hypothetical protein